MSRQGSAETGSRSAAASPRNPCRSRHPEAAESEERPTPRSLSSNTGTISARLVVCITPSSRSCKTDIPGKIKLEYHHYPLIQSHSNAMAASLAAEVGRRTGQVLGDA